MANSTHKMGLLGLTALVFSSIVGGGIYNISQNMAQHAGLGAIIISWVITAVGMLFLVLTFKALADRRPDLNGGIYQYAQEGFGNYVGFNVAWGYWLCTAVGNVAYAVMLNDSTGAFFPSLLKHGFPTVVFGTALIWLMYLLVSRGLKTASFVNTVISVIQVITLIVIIGILVIYFKLGLFTYDFWGRITDLGGVGHQVKETMLVTLWCFTGIEGAIMMSSRAKKASDVGKAGIIGFLSAWLLYALVSVLSFGLMKQPEIASLPDPSIAYILKSVCGSWAYYFVIVAVIVSLIGGWIAWTLVCAQVPYEAANVKIFPKQFLRMNKSNMPSYGLIVSSIVMNIFLCVVVTAQSVYEAALDLTSLMALPSYLFSGIFLWMESRKSKFSEGMSDGRKTWYWIVGALATVFCAYIFYATNWTLLVITLLFYLPGTYFYVKARKQYFPGEKVFTSKEKFLFCLLIAGCVAALVLLIMGKATF